MKIGIYLLDAVVTGTTKFVFELADGLREVGHDVWTVTSTKSGREPKRWTHADGGARWWHQSPDVTMSHDDLPNLLDWFDLVIVNDIGSSTLDSSEDFAKQGVPGYVYGLLRTRTPWVPVAHGNSYDVRHAPHFPRLLADSLRPPRAVMATSAPYSYAEHDLFKTLTAVPMRRPYASRCGVDDHVAPNPGQVIMTGRYSTGKNLHALGLTLPFAGENTDGIYLAGATIASARPTDPYLTYETLIARDDIKSIVTPASVNKTAEWSVENTRGQGLSYLGGYVDPLPLLSQSKLFVNLTDEAFSAGTEYTTMEALDAGCLLLATTNMIDNGSSIAYGALESWRIPKNPKKTMTCEDELKKLAERVDRALATSEDTSTQFARYNRSVLNAEHSPFIVAKTMMSDLEGVA